MRLHSIWRSRLEETSYLTTVYLLTNKAGMPPYCCDKAPPQKRIKTGRVYPGLQFEVQSSMVGKSRQQKLEAAGYVTTKPKAESKMNESSGLSMALQFYMVKDPTKRIAPLRVRRSSNLS